MVLCNFWLILNDVISALTVLANEVQTNIQQLGGILNIVTDLGGVLQDILALVNNLVKEAAHDVTENDETVADLLAGHLPGDWGVPPSVEPAMFTFQTISANQGS